MARLARNRRPRADDPFEDDGTGYIDPTPGLLVGGIDSIHHPYDPTEEEIDEMVAEVEARKKRRIPLGFQLPTKDQP